MDFTGLNKACPKDSYPLPQVDILVDSTAQHQLLSFMDAFQVITRLEWVKQIERRFRLLPTRASFAIK